MEDEKKYKVIIRIETGDDENSYVKQEFLVTENDTVNKDWRETVEELLDDLIHG